MFAVTVVEDGLAQAVPEHPKRDNIFCLSTAFGDAYLLQADNQIELENWVTAIHSGEAIGTWAMIEEGEMAGLFIHDVVNHCIFYDEDREIEGSRDRERERGI